MKCLIYSDPHWCQNSSIIRSRREKYSSRLENLIHSINWVERLAWDNDADCVICCGDFFDSSVLNSEEISALQEIRWAPLSHLFLTGNHETNVNSLNFSTTDLFKLCPNVSVLNTPQQYMIEGTSVEFCFLPYISERDRKPIVEYFGSPTTNRVIFSHNDLKDVQYGAFLSTEGFEVEDIHNNCNLYFNGHIHHCYNVTDKIINIGNLTGQNFTEDALKYKHCAIILDTETLNYEFYENPYGFSFCKIDATECNTQDDFLNKLRPVFDNLHCVVSTVTVQEDIATYARDILENLKEFNLVEYRLIVKHNSSAQTDFKAEINNSDHLKQFETYVLSEIGDSEIIKQELQTILR